MTTAKRGLLPRTLQQWPDRKTAALETMRQVLLEISPQLNLRISPRAKRMALRLDSRTGKIHLVLPPRASLRKGLEFAREHQDWITRHAAEAPAPVTLGNGSILPVLGQDRVIRVSYDENLKRTSISLTENEIIVSTNKEDPTGRIVRHLKDYAREEITRLSREKALKINRAPRAIRIGDTKSRWGSCSQEGNLSFSWRLVLAPQAAFDYVVAHEVAHLAHMDHGKAFWALCAELSEDFKTGHEWMKKHGHRLMRYC